MKNPAYMVGSAQAEPFIPTGCKVDASDAAMVAAINGHTAALLELAQAIREHAYLTAPEEDEDDEPSTYMDGTPVQ